MVSECGDTYWYAIHTHLRQEDRVDDNLRAWGMTTFSPKIKEQVYNEYSGKITYLIKPLFPRYMFARFKIDQLHQVSFTRGVYRVVSSGDVPNPVADEIIAEIKSRIDADGCVRILEELAPGDEVMVENGPLRNFKGIFERKVSTDDRVRMLLEAVSYQAYLEIERESIRRIGRS